MSRSARRSVAASALLVATLVATVVAPAVPGSSAVGDNHGCQGGSPSGNPSSTSSTTSHTTHSRFDLPDVVVLRTRVLAVVDGATLSDTTIGADPTSPAVAGLILEAGHAVRDAGAVPAPPVEIGTEVEAIEAFVGSFVTGTEQTVTTTTASGPQTILVGDGQTVNCFIPAGTTNVNVNTHTETFAEDRFQVTQTVTVTLLVAGALTAVVAPARFTG